MKRWYEEPMVISAVQCEIPDSFEVLREYSSKHFNVEQLLHTHANGYSAIYEEELFGEKVKKYLKEAREKGLREIVYYNCHFFNEKQLKGNENCLIVDKEGKTMPAYQTGAYTCINADYMKKAKKDLVDIMEKDVDGIFLDGPLALGKCYCKHCVKDFEEMYHKNYDEATYEELMKFNIMKVTRFVKMCNEVVKSINPDVVLYLNNSALCADITGSNTRELCDYVDFLGAEGGFVWVDKASTNWPVSPMAKILESQSNGKPTVIFIAGDYKPWSYYMHTAEETLLYYAQTIANGANVWYGLHGPTDQVNTPGGKMALEMNKFILDNKEIFSDHKSVSRVALMWSQNTANYYKSSVTVSDFRESLDKTAGEDSEFFSDHYNAFYGAYEMLARNHIQHDVIDEVNVTNGDLSKYDLLIMPTCACVSDREAEKIAEFVKNGGNLITTYDTGFYDENGKPATFPKLGALQGMKKIHEFFSYSGLGNGYMRDNTSALFEGVSWTKLPSAILSFKAEFDGKVHGEYSYPMTSRYTDYPTEWYPSIVENEFGKGKVICFTGAVCEFYKAYSNPDTKKIFTNAVTSLSNPIVTTDAPGSVEMVLRKLENGYALHCINFTGEMERPLSRVIELSDVKVKLAISDVKGEVKSIRGENPVDIKVSGDFVEFTIPKMGEYEIITIK